MQDSVGLRIGVTSPRRGRTDTTVFELPCSSHKRCRPRRFSSDVTGEVARKIMGLTQQYGQSLELMEYGNGGMMGLGEGDTLSSSTIPTFQYSSHPPVTPPSFVRGEAARPTGAWQFCLCFFG